MSMLQSAISRRSLLGGGLAGGLLLAFHLPTYGASEPAQGGTKGKFAPNAFIRIDPAGKTTLVMPQVEMGQGVYTSVAMILAEELDADYQQIVLEQTPFSVSRSPVTPTPSVPSGSRCARREPRRAPC